MRSEILNMCVLVNAKYKKKVEADKKNPMVVTDREKTEA